MTPALLIPSSDRALNLPRFPAELFLDIFSYAGRLTLAGLPLVDLNFLELEGTTSSGVSREMKTRCCFVEVQASRPSSDEGGVRAEEDVAGGRKASDEVESRDWTVKEEGRKDNLLASM
jgi:hypothetical protein